jgi:HK97 family phage prohead protease
VSKSKEFVLSDESLNSYGYWIKTDGIGLEAFKKNPVMLWNHGRSWSDSQDTILPIGRWENVRVEDGRLLGEAVFDSDDAFAKKIAQKVANGTLSACSIGLEALELSEAPEHLKPGQTRRTITKSELLEVSIVDIPANRNAVAHGVALYEKGKLVELAGGLDCPVPLIQALNSETNKDKSRTKMKTIATKLGLAAEADQTAIVSAIEAMEAELKSAKESQAQLQTELNTLKAAKAEAETAEAAALVDAALKSGRIDAAGKEAFMAMFKSDFNAAKTALKAIPERQRTSLSGMVKPVSNPGATLAITAEQWDALDRQNKLESLRATDFETYKELFHAKFGKEIN